MAPSIDEQYLRYCLWLSIYIALMMQPDTEPVADGYVRKLAREKFHQAHDEFLNNEDDDE